MNVSIWMSNPCNGGCCILLVRSRKSNIGTFQDLWVICSTLDLSDASATSQIPCPLIKQNILATNSAAVNAPWIADDIAGSFGAGGNTGSSRFTCGINPGSAGNCGGAGSCGIFGMVNISKLMLTVGGAGRFGICGRGILVGTNMKFGRVIFIPILIRDRSKKIFGILNGGIGMTGICGHINDSVHE